MGGKRNIRHGVNRPSKMRLLRFCVEIGCDRTREIFSVSLVLNLLLLLAVLRRRRVVHVVRSLARQFWKYSAVQINVFKGCVI